MLLRTRIESVNSKKQFIDLSSVHELGLKSSPLSMLSLQLFYLCSAYYHILLTIYVEGTNQNKELLQTILYD